MADANSEIFRRTTWLEIKDSKWVFGSVSVLVEMLVKRGVTESGFLY